MSTLRMAPGSLASFDAELAGDDIELARLLAVEAIEEWPPIGGEHDAEAVAFFRRALAADPALSGWQAYYVCAGSSLVGSAGFMGPPRGGVVEIGYSICARFRRRGFATRAVAALVRRAAAEGAGRIVARTKPANLASIAVLERNGFARLKSVRDGVLSFARDTERLTL